MTNDNVEELLSRLRQKINAHLEAVRTYKLNNSDFFDNI